MIYPPEDFGNPPFIPFWDSGNAPAGFLHGYFILFFMDHYKQILLAFKKKFPPAKSEPFEMLSTDEIFDAINQFFPSSAIKETLCEDLMKMGYPYEPILMKDLPLLFVWKVQAKRQETHA